MIPTLGMTDASECLRSTTITCTARSGGKIDATVAISCNNPADQVGVVSLVIEEYRNGSWVIVASQYSDYQTNTYSYNATISYNGTADTQYRSKATVRCLYNGTYEYRYPEYGTVTAKP